MLHPGIPRVTFTLGVGVPWNTRAGADIIIIIIISIICNIVNIIIIIFKREEVLPTSLLTTLGFIKMVERVESCPPFGRGHLGWPPCEGS